MTRRPITRVAAFLVAAAAVFIPARAWAQPSFVMSAGVKGGVNIANVDFKLPGLSISPQSRPGLVIGGFFAMDKKMAGFAVEGLFSQHGTTLEFNDVGFTDTLEIRVNYIAIPVLGRVNLKASDAAMVHLYLGPMFGFKTNAETKETATINGQTMSMTDTDDSDVEGTVVDLTFGGQVDFHRFLVDLRYNLGLTNINKNTGVDQPEVKDRTFSIMFGVRLK